MALGEDFDAPGPEAIDGADDAQLVVRDGLGDDRRGRLELRALRSRLNGIVTVGLPHTSSLP